MNKQVILQMNLYQGNFDPGTVEEALPGIIHEVCTGSDQIFRKMVEDNLEMIEDIAGVDYVEEEHKTWSMYLQLSEHFKPLIRNSAAYHQLCELLRDHVIDEVSSIDMYTIAIRLEVG